MDTRVSDDLLKMTREEVEKKKAETYPVERLKGFYRNKDAKKQDDKKLLEDTLTKTVRGTSLKQEFDKNVAFNVAQKTQASERLKLVHKFNKEAAELAELHRKGKLELLP